MMRRKHSQKGFGTIEIIIVVLIVAALGFGAWFVYDKQSNNQQQSQTTKDTTKYLDINEIGIRLQLTDNTSDAYYVIGNESSQDKPTVYLSTHSLDAYPDCAANTRTGVATILTFTEGYQDEVVGDFATAYPAAPKINNLFYYVAGSQNDCTNGAATDLYSQVKHDLVDSYSTIEKL